MDKKEIKKLLNVKSMPCVTIVIPTHRLATFRQADESTVIKVINNAKAELQHKFADSPRLEAVLNNLNSVAATIDYTHMADGIGIYVSADEGTLLHFPFPVTEKLLIGDSFDSRDLLFALNNIMDYYTLSISKKYVRLFRCSGTDIEEIRDGAFPMEYREEFEYVKPSMANSFAPNVLVGYEKDKTVMQEERLKEFLRVTDKNLEKYVKSDTYLVVAGDNKEIYDFSETTSYSKNVLAKVKGNYVLERDLAQHAWDEIQNYTRQKNELLFSDIVEQVGKDKAVTGVEDIWKAANEGKGLKLILEKDYTQAGYVTKDGSAFVVKKPVKAGNYVHSENIADALIKSVMDKNGRVLFVENGSLSKFKGIALVLRYS